jgi:hypothetical protein
MGKGEVPDREEINIGTFLKSAGIRCEIIKWHTNCAIIKPSQNNKEA